ncbi:MAG: Oxidoreductase (flavoprotein) [Candidatus Carbobacillus altaicus]|uniref:Oxidoreductase (Flavoprotein) n=1 Tax=Candidatus Carbonibacillus altaicus TaxID=2163959 RepID=A0A2R6Y489_9BACL|nr:MAG: Oxidoreductase (flavoprotein) [Candidatus Carbobacillus altaicus]
MHVVIIGGGTGGLGVANRLGRLLYHELKRGEHAVTLITDRELHDYQPGYMFSALNTHPMQHYTRKTLSLLHYAVDFVLAEVQEIDLESKKVTADTVYDYDLLVIATGSIPDIESMPGLKDTAFTFYTKEGAEKLRSVLAHWKGGRVVVTIDLPHKCPAAPLEFPLLLDHQLRARGMRPLTDIVYTYPLDRLNVLESLDAWAKPEFERRSIRFEASFIPERVDVDRRVLIGIDKRSIPFDLLVVVPRHRGSKLIRKMKVADDLGFLPTDPAKLKLQGYDDVYVLGDATNLSFPYLKTGATAHFQSEVIAKNIADRLRGLPETAMYDGKFICFLDDTEKSSSFIYYDHDHPPRVATTGGLMHLFREAYHELYWLTVRGLL